jgi:hypothetical protein
MRPLSFALPGYTQITRISSKSSHSVSHELPDEPFSVAKERSWFAEDYTPFKTFVVDDMLSTGPLEVIGVGTVHLPVKSLPYEEGPRAQGTMHLEYVLHAPGCVCNMLGNVRFKNYKLSPISFSDEEFCGHYSNALNDQPVAWLIRKRFMEIVLSEPPLGPKVGPSPFKPGVAYMLRATWPVAEQQKFAALKSSQDTSECQIEAMTLNLTEKAWLRKHWVNEFRFLRSYGLSIYYEEDREEGGKILRKLMENDADVDYDN